MLYNAHFERTWERKNLGEIRKLFTSSSITKEEILQSPKDYVMLFRPSMLRLDFGGAFPPSVKCLYSYWSGYLVRKEWSDFKSQLAAAGGEFIECHTSGHIFAEDIVKFVTEVKPKWVVPIHTGQPETFSKLFSNCLLIADGEPRLI